MKSNGYKIKKYANGIMIALVMAIALIVPSAVQAETKTSTGWKIAALNSVTSAPLYYDGEKLGMLTVKSTGSQIISSYQGTKIKCKVDVGTTKHAIRTKIQYASSVTVAYGHRGSAYGMASYVD